ncbi:MAG TPA: DUF6712 family protein [Saprospiraceae bacterium]|nr:DUF6712 family protein [Saprospiraceae bacterium]
MDLVFKKLKTQPNAKDYTIGDTNFREHYAAINANTAWDTIEPTIRKATQKYVIPVIGEAMYNAIASPYLEGITIVVEPAQFAKILEKLQDTVAYFTIMHFGPEINLLISDTGANERGSADGSVRPTSQWRYKDFKWDICKKADELLDELVNMLDTFVLEGVVTVNPWKNDPLYEVQKTWFFNSAKTFGDHQHISLSRKVFNMMYRDIITTEDAVKKIIGSAQFTALVTLVNTEKPEDMSPAFQELLRLIRNFVSAKAMGLSIPRLSVIIDALGIKFSNFNDGMESFSNSETTMPGAGVIGSFAFKCMVDSERDHNTLIEFIYDNIDDYPLIAASQPYAAAAEDVGTIICPGDGGVWL